MASEAALEMEREVLAVVVSYNPGAGFVQHLAALRSQIDHVAVIDNGSSDFAAVQEAARQTGCRLMANPTNLGIAAALNQGLAWAQAKGARWLATFDQDSLLPPGAINGLLALHEAHPQRDRVAMMAMAHRDRGTQRDYHHRLDILETMPDWRSLRSTITSGSLVRIDVLVQAGGFDEALFIDSVDHDVCMRLRRRGWLIIESRLCVLAHSIGDATEHRLLGRRIVCTHHSAIRRYYMTRNQLEVCRRNLLFDPVWALKGVAQVAAGSVAALLYEKHKRAKLGAMLLGMGHFALRRFGPKP